MKRIILIASYVFVFGGALYLGTLIVKPGASITGSAPQETKVQLREHAADPDIPSISRLSPLDTVDISELETLPTIFRIQLRAHEIAARSNEEELKGYIDHFLHSEDYLYSNNIALVFLARLIEIDPRVAIGYVEGLAVNQGKRQILLASVLTTWARYEPEAAIDYLGGLMLNQRMVIGQRLLQDPVFLASGHQSQLMALLGVRGEALQSSLAMRSRPPAEAFDHALGLSGRHRLSGMMTAVSHWMQTDADAAIARIAELPESRERQQMLSMVISNLAQTDAFAAYDRLQTLIGDNPRLSSQVIVQMMGQDPDRGLSYFESFVAEHGYQHSAQSAIQAWASRDFDAALAYVMRSPERDRFQLEIGLGQAYLETDPRAAMKWAMTEGSGSTLQMMASMLPHHDVELAEDWVTRLDDEQLSSQLLSSLVSYKANYGESSILEWLSEFEDHSGYAAALSQYFMQAGFRNPGLASEHLMNYVDDETFVQAFSQVASSWAARSPEDAMDWVESLPRGPNREQAQRSLLFGLANRDVDMTLSLIDDMDSTQVDSVALQVAGTLLSQHPSDRQRIIRELGLTAEEVDGLPQTMTRSSAVSVFGAYPLNE